MLNISKTSNYEGKILINGVQVMKLDASTSKGQINYINQEIYDYVLFSQNATEVMKDQNTFTQKIMNDLEEENKEMLAGGEPKMFKSSKSFKMGKTYDDVLAEEQLENEDETIK